jgi:2-C-methyl-D-erythritol 4-phosphate cytidylyltransferase
MRYDDETPPPVGIVPVDGRGSMPFALLHGESLVAVASWSMGDAGVELVDFDTSWDDVRARDAALVVHDPLCPGTPAWFIEEAVRVSAERDVVVAGVRPVTDTVKTADGDVLGETVDRSGLLAVSSPVVIPASVVASLAALPSVDDLADLVTGLREAHEVALVEAPPAARRVSDESDLRLVESIASSPPAG